MVANDSKSFSSVSYVLPLKLRGSTRDCIQRAVAVVCRKPALVAISKDCARIQNQGPAPLDHPRGYKRDTQIEDRGHIQAL
jgi:hypothetical protein